MASPFVCQMCGDMFSLAQNVLDRYPGWTPRECMDCRAKRLDPTVSKKPGKANSGSGKTRTRTALQLLTTAQVLLEFRGGPQSGVFTDGGSVPNPGPGGWGAVYVVDGQIVAEASGNADATTNNRMELRAFIEGMALVPAGENATIYSDSKLVVNTITQWAAGWKARGWRRKTGPVENLDLVEPAYETFKARSELELAWISAHSGERWNEYADALASAWRL